MTRPAIVFDLDGTLVDSLDDIVSSFLAAFDRLSLPKPDRQEVRSLVGRPLEEMYARFAQGERKDALVAAYREHYPKHLVDTTRPYPGVVDVLSELGERGYARVVASTKRPGIARALVEAVGLGRLLDHVQGTEGFAAKPAPDVILHALRAAGAEGVWMVGDSVSDLQAGRAAGLKTYGVTWGTHGADELATAEPDALEPDLLPLLSLL